MDGADVIVGGGSVRIRCLLYAESEEQDTALIIKVQNLASEDTSVVQDGASGFNLTYTIFY